MKGTIAALFIIIAIATAAFAGGDLARTDGRFVNQAPIQFFAPDGSTTSALTVASTTVDLTNYILFGIESGSGTTCYVRSMPTSTKSATYKQTLLRTAGTLYVRAKNAATPFVNISGCTAGSYSLQ